MALYRKHINIIGVAYGCLEVIEELDPYIDPNGHAKRKVRCKCVCGEVVDRLLVLITSTKHNHNCGCKNSRHKASNTPIHRMWGNMKKRCFNQNASGYKYYGGRGILVCAEWENSFDTFFSWALTNGYKDGLQIDRIDTGGNYSPNNCRFVTREVNMNNRTNNIPIQIDGETLSLADACRKFNVYHKYAIVRQRMKTQKWGFEKAIIF